jgi:2,4-dienoyl-CoA reductase-like NADH-dependent reductase (Old Yellow Enzyme family)/thioredoxin reductase
LKNRLVCPPMVRNYGTERGFVTQRSIDHYQTIAKGGVGLIIVEATCVDAPRGRGWDYGLVLDDDAFIEGFAKLADAIHPHGSKVAVQLHHAGSGTDIRTTHMPQFGPTGGPSFVQELTLEGIAEVVRKFAKAAGRAKKAGLDGVEIHMAHKYLIAQFLSSATNRRQDFYGGSPENRAKFALEVLKAVRESVGRDFPVWCRINGQELGIENGITVEEAQALAVRLEKAGADALHVSASGAGKYLGYNGGVMCDPPGNLVPLAASIKQVVHIPVIAVGKLNLQLAEEVLRDGKADLVALGRSLLADPDLPIKAQQGRYEDIRPCIWCRTCGDVFLYKKRSGIRCQVNAALGYEGEYPVTEAVRRKKVLVIGGGPSGMEAARVAALRGHKVTLYEKNERLGGNLVLAAFAPHKDPIRLFAEYLENQVRKLGVEVVTGREVTIEVVASLRPDAAVMATGSTPLTPGIKGIDSQNVFSALDVLRGKIGVGKRVVIIGGGMVGSEVADFLSERGHQVTVVELLDQIAGDIGIRMRARLLDRLEEKGVVLMTSTRCLEISGREVLVLDSRMERLRLDCDTIVVAAGAAPNRDLWQAILELVPEAYLIGDCLEPHQILEAVADGFRIGSTV